MIDRYQRDEFASFWSEEKKYQTWLKVEGYVCEAFAKQGLVSEEFVKEYWAKTKVDIDRINAIEAQVHHDVIAFLTTITEQIKHPDKKFIHYGLTSSDVLDTSLSVILREVSMHLCDLLIGVRDSIFNLANKHKYLRCLGRTHGIHAENTTLGLKFLHHTAIFDRAVTKLKAAIDEISSCKISGAVGNFMHISPEIEQYVAGKLSLTPDTCSTQVIGRDRHASLCAVFAIIASAIENVSTEIRGLQRTEISEVHEGFGGKQKGSSAMPHKKNPVITENLTGIARLIRSIITPALENVTLWHERDISHSSVERVIFPDATSLLDFALHRLINLFDDLHVDEEAITNNVESVNNIWSQSILLYLLRNTDKTREDAYRIVQVAAFSGDLLGYMQKEYNISPDEIKFHDADMKKSVDFIFNRYERSKN